MLQIRRAFIPFLIVGFCLIGLFSVLFETVSAEIPSDSTHIATTQTRSLYIFGDSWADQLDNSVIQAELVARNLDREVTVYPLGDSGTTMAQWANDADGRLTNLLNQIINDPNSNPIVFFTLGGNDILGGGLSAATSVNQNLSSLLAQLEASRSDLQIVYAQYDILNPNVQSICSPTLNALFGSTQPAVVNNTWLGLYNQSEQVVANFSRTQIVNTYGALQGNPGNPDITSWSPVQYISDCIHLNASGYDLYLDPIFDDALTSLIQGNMPVSPTIQIGNVTSTTATFSWAANPAATSYDLLRTTTPFSGTYQVHEIGVTSPLDIPVYGQTNYFYKVRANGDVAADSAVIGAFVFALDSGS